MTEVSSENEDQEGGGVSLLQQDESDDDIEMDSPGRVQPTSKSARVNSASAFMPPPPLPPRSRFLANHPSRRFLPPGQSGLQSKSSASKMDLDDSDSDEPRSRPSGRARTSLSTSSPLQSPAASSFHRMVAAPKVLGAPSPLRRQASQVSNAAFNMQDLQDQTSQLRISLLRKKLALDENEDDAEVLADYSQKSKQV